jgi:RNA polymerase sigma-70 factor (ECF subfamily)
LSHLEVFAEYRAYLFSIACRMLGCAMDAEDLLQETFLQWQQTALGKIRSPKAFLATVVRNLCLNQLQSAHVRREERLESLDRSSSAPLPTESLAKTSVCDPESAASLSDSLCLALRVLFERLPPKERLVFLLREVFDYEYEEIAGIVRKSATNCRQMLLRARRHVMSDRLRFVTSPEQLDQLVRQFARTCSTGDLEGLVSLMS